MRRSDRRPVPRPPLKPVLTFGSGAIDAGVRTVADALVAAYRPTCAWQWACEIHVVPSGRLFTLRFRRHDHGSHESIMDAYDLTWRELAEVPSDVDRYACVIMDAAAEWRQRAVQQHCDAWSRAKRP